jgi:hypothetical protein
LDAYAVETVSFNLIAESLAVIDYSHWFYAFHNNLVLAAVLPYLST